MKFKELTETEILIQLKTSLKGTGKFQENFEHEQQYRWACINEIHRRGGINFLKKLN